EKWSGRMERLARLVPGPIGRPAIVTPFGRVSLFWLVGLRMYDEWIPDEDIRRALGRPSDDAAASVRPVARQILAGIPVQTAPRIARASLGRVVLSFDDVAMPLFGVDLTASTFGYGIETGDARLTGRAATIAMVAARRDAWRDVESAGGLKIEGDRRPAETFMDALLLV